MIWSILRRPDLASTPVQEYPELLRELRARYLRAARFTAPATVPTATLYAAILVPSANTTALVAWWALTMTQLVTYWPVFRRADLSDRWHRQTIVAQVVGGIVWSLVPIVAMPATTEWQMFVATMTLGVLASNAMFAASLHSTFVSFLVPFTSLTFVGFVLNTEGSVRLVTAGLVLYAAGFSAVLGAIRRADDVEAASLGIRNGRLAESLEAESEALRIAAADLASVNDRLEYEATHDSLTGLASRPVFVDTLRQAIDAETAPGSVGVMFLDLDRFKFVNDSFGHTVGDALLQAVAGRLSVTLDDDEVLARMGGDELVALVHLGSRRTAAESADRVLAALDEPFVLGDRPVSIGASVGIAVSDGDSGAADLLRFADTALLRSKTDGRGRCTVFDAAMRLELERRSRMADELRNAIGSPQMTAFLQPIVEIATGRVAGAEALSRWSHPSGVRSAGAYMDLAAELGLEADISIGVIETVAALQERLLRDTVPWITVNMPPQQLGQVFEHFRDAPEILANLTLEITERAAVADLSQAQLLLSAAREAGAQVFLDDFGVGQSSLSVLTDLPLDGIKIDAGFVRQLNASESARAVVETISDLGRRLDLAVIAEGVETGEQAERLADLGIELVQGFLYAPPLPADAFIDWCADRSTGRVGESAPPGV
ncbi:MAG: EAL domain-containing protein [Actinomycetota bacterium]